MGIGAGGDIDPHWGTDHTLWGQRGFQLNHVGRTRRVRRLAPAAVNGGLGRIHDND